MKASGGSTKGCLQHLKSKHDSLFRTATQKRAAEHSSYTTLSFTDTHTENPVPTSVAIIGQCAQSAIAVIPQFNSKMLPLTSNTLV